MEVRIANGRIFKSDENKLSWSDDDGKTWPEFNWLMLEDAIRSIKQNEDMLIVSASRNRTYRVHGVFEKDLNESPLFYIELWQK